MRASDLLPSAITLRKGQTRRIGAARGQRIEALTGSLWVTMDHDRRDIVVAPGDGFEIDRDGETLVSALTDARFVLMDATSIPAEGRLFPGVC